MTTTLVLLLFACSTSLARGLLRGRPCFIPTGNAYRNSVFSLAYYSDRHAYADVSAVFDGNWKFLPGARVFHGKTVLVACTGNIYGDAVHRSYRRTCRNGKWSRQLPDCSANEYCGPLNINVTGAVSATPVSPGIMFPHGYVMEFACTEYYLIRGNNSVICQDGNWTEPVFYCIPNYCYTPYRPGVVMTSQALENMRYPNEFVVEFRCAIGWILAGSGFLICRDRKWIDMSGQVSPCKRYKAVGLDVSNVTAEASNGTDVLVTWQLASDASRDTIEYFRILYSTDFRRPPEDWTWQRVPGDSNSATLEWLVPNEVYVVGVVAGDGVGEGAMSNRAYVFVRGSIKTPDSDDDYGAEDDYDSYSDNSDWNQEDQFTVSPPDTVDQSITARGSTQSVTTSTDKITTKADARNKSIVSDTNSQFTYPYPDNQATGSDADNQSLVADTDRRSTDSDIDNQSTATYDDSQTTVSSGNTQSTLAGSNSPAKTTAADDSHSVDDDSESSTTSAYNQTTLTDHSDSQSTAADVQNISSTGDGSNESKTDDSNDPSTTADVDKQSASESDDDQSTSAEYNQSTQTDDDTQSAAETDDDLGSSVDNIADQSTEAEYNPSTETYNPSSELDVDRHESTMSNATDPSTTLDPSNCLSLTLPSSIPSRPKRYSGNTNEQHTRHVQSVPHDTTNGQPTSFPHGTTLTYNCSQNAVLVGNSTMTCNNGVWETSNFTCRAGKSCGKLRLPKGRPVRILASYDHGSVVKIFCNRRRNRSTRRGTFTCSDGDWVGDKFACLQRRRIIG